MVEPIDSGRQWEADPRPNVVSEGRSVRTWVRDPSDASVRALFKRPNPGSAEPGEIYSMGMERVAYVLGAKLGLPLPRVCLEEYEGHPGSLQWRIHNSRNWQHAPACPMLMTEIINERQLSLAFMFDVWMANTDRFDRNLLAQSDPSDKAPKYATKCKFWLIDHGCTALWFPSKFDRGLTGRSVEEVVVTDGTMIEEVQRAVVGFMPPLLRRACHGLSPEDRDQLVLDPISAITDNDLEEAIADVPTEFMTDEAKELTGELLKARRDRAEQLYQALVP